MTVMQGSLLGAPEVSLSQPVPTVEPFGPPRLREPFLRVSGANKPRIIVVVEHFEDEDAPLLGAAGQFFREELTRQQIPLDRIGFCYHDALEEAKSLLSGAHWLLVSGLNPLRVWRPDLHIRECHGRPFLAKGTLDGLAVFPIMHYVSFYRVMSWRNLLRQELALFVRYVVARYEGQNWYAESPDTCVKCRGEFWGCDRQGIVYCKEHWETHQLQ